MQVCEVTSRSLSHVVLNKKRVQKKRTKMQMKLKQLLMFHSHAETDEMSLYLTPRVS